ncbi:RDD family protein [Homoserinibacter sp. GY 40078]|uniref:RDD family protein n=1 Tax=Homoserinibacter sp. GY 40078 TaxID=2603275 RepID=UPI0011CC2279|nr:RDD family protein [Homoserinibacter sp. GY 40078]TXK17469.1 RDD family protein [Homoserinibacter sp. GY 40078]
MSSESGASSTGEWPGERLGLPEQGPRSIARVGRRIVALVIDWAVAYFLSWALFPTPEGAAPFVTLGIFALLQYLFLLVVNGGLGHLILGIRLVPIRGGYLGLWRPLVRTVLLCLVIPAVIWDRDQRGLHDKAAGTVLVRI